MVAGADGEAGGSSDAGAIANGKSDGAGEVSNCVARDILNSDNWLSGEVGAVDKTSSLSGDGELSGGTKLKRDVSGGGDVVWIRNGGRDGLGTNCAS